MNSRPAILCGDTIVWVGGSTSLLGVVSAMPTDKEFLRAIARPDARLGVLIVSLSITSPRGLATITQNQNLFIHAERKEVWKVKQRMTKSCEGWGLHTTYQMSRSELGEWWKHITKAVGQYKSLFNQILFRGDNEQSN